ncbi:hypothetical protein K458DRAFT_407357 [Lentithecium fluviatile CBS 122367]|uniref:Uncharacterized protein n=1 Tax=Lentithecium fluviatile CBS 122367 TaxID=1168545 RepID=A0A6G1IQ16_9PLEO|nr:hypothetical protein K458DRAFT_407357 [Lentithecium fluviatile CBS 122367]
MCDIYDTLSTITNTTRLEAITACQGAANTTYCSPDNGTRANAQLRILHFTVYWPPGSYPPDCSIILKWAQDGYAHGGENTGDSKLSFGQSAFEEAQPPEQVERALPLYIIELNYGPDKESYNLTTHTGPTVTLVQTSSFTPTYIESTTTWPTPTRPPWPTTTTWSYSTPPSKSYNASPNTSRVVGILVGVLIPIILLVAILVLARKRRLRRKNGNTGLPLQQNRWPRLREESDVVTMERTREEPVTRSEGAGGVARQRGPNEDDLPPYEQENPPRSPLSIAYGPATIRVVQGSTRAPVARPIPARAQPGLSCEPWLLLQLLPREIRDVINEKLWTKAVVRFLQLRIPFGAFYGTIHRAMSLSGSLFIPTTNPPGFTTKLPVWLQVNRQIIREGLEQLCHQAVFFQDARTPRPTAKTTPTRQSSRSLPHEKAYITAYWPLLCLKFSTTVQYFQRDSDSSLP